ncbi:unnamed protein product [Bemisia tabaci]|uniref:DUF7775 domain-containing protein n=1 Tax=Bemisia tabaci TaxID=7038 RepID=A0A9P0CBF5_BEMTA|nr:PREDICTED: uncharacterized protein LOC109041925 isoform X1 [Bemisia tabaci]CAH0773932.1 unnamed protein product [Bemisia tabaci]
MPITRITGVKFIELILTIIIFFLHYKSFESNDTHSLFLSTATFAGYFIIMLGSFVGYLTGNPINKKIDLFFVVLGAILYLASGFYSIQHFSGWAYNKDQANLGLTKGWLAVVNGIIFIVDAVFVYQDGGF